MPAQNSDHLIIFTKAPRLGFVKTRMASDMGDEKALAAYERLLDATYAATQSFQNVEIRYWPDDAARELKARFKNSSRFSSQGDGDLGQKLKQAYTDAFRAGAKRVAIIGSDCPYILKKDIVAAFDSLAKHDLVLGPATDGGYWLIGLRAEQPALFENIPWSSSDTLAETLRAGRNLNLKMDLLRILSDIDTEEDWKEYQTTLASDPSKKVLPSGNGKKHRAK